MNEFLLENSRTLSIGCPVLTFAIFELMFIIPSPVTDIDFLLLFTGCALALLLPSVGLITSRKLISKDNPKNAPILGRCMLVLNGFMLFSSFGICIIVGLVGTTGSY